VQLRWPRVRVPSGPASQTASVGGFSEARKKQQEAIRELREFIESARRYKTAFEAKDPLLKEDLRLQAMIPVLNGTRPLIVFANTGRYIREAVEFAKEQKLRIVIAGADEFGDTLPLLKENNIPVVLGPTHRLPPKRDLPYDYQSTLPAEVAKAGVKFCFGSFGTQFARNLPYDVGNAVAYGLPHEEALKAITLYPAEIWGIADKLGSVEKGKIADLVVTDHEDPLELTTSVKYLFIRGERVNLESKHTRLYERYLNRPKATER
jgi:imidazolonepropionase-like amidohydrolase